jgi:hypothetical protein
MSAAGFLFLNFPAASLQLAWSAFNCEAGIWFSAKACSHDFANRQFFADNVSAGFLSIDREAGYGFHFVTSYLHSKNSVDSVSYFEYSQALTKFV